MSYIKETILFFLNNNLFTFYHYFPFNNNDYEIIINTKIIKSKDLSRLLIISIILNIFPF
jgi:hypothetical protein